MDIFDNKESGFKRKLISFSYLAQASIDSNDYIGGIASIFKPIVRMKSGKTFDESEFCTLVDDLYGLKLTVLAVRDLMPRLVKRGFLIKDMLSDGVCRYLYSEMDEEFTGITERDIGDITDKFIEYALPSVLRNDLDVGKEELAEAFLDHLTDMNFISVALKPNEYSYDSEDKKNISNKRSKLNILCAGFVVSAYHNDLNLYNLIVSIVSGALVSEVVLNFQEPDEGVNLNRVNIILDTPFLMEYLNLSCPKEHEFSKDLCDMLVENGATLSVFSHSVDELKGNLRAVTENFKKNTAFGATGRRLRDSSFSVYLNSILNDPELALRTNKIKVLKAIDHATSLKFFSEGLMDSLANSLGDYYNRIARERDVKSIAMTMRYRNGTKSHLKDFYKQNYIFLTENSFIPDISMKFMVRNDLLEERCCPPSMSCRYLSGLLMVLFGAKGKNLSRKLLLANCSAVLEPNAGVVKKMYSFLDKVDSSQADLFESLMGDERAGQYLMQHSLGNTSFLTQDNAPDVLNNLKNSLIEKHEVDKAAEIKGIELSHEKLRSSEINDLQESHRQEILSIEIESFNALLGKIGLQVKLALKAKKRFEMLSILLIFSLMIYAGVNFDNENHLLVVIFTALLSIVGFWFIPEKTIGRLSRYYRDYVFKNMISNKELEFDDCSMNVDWAKGEITDKRIVE